MFCVSWVCMDITEWRLKITDSMQTVSCWQRNDKPLFLLLDAINVRKCSKNSFHLYAKNPNWREFASSFHNVMNLSKPHTKLTALVTQPAGSLSWPPVTRDTCTWRSVTCHAQCSWQMSATITISTSSRYW